MPAMQNSAQRIVGAARSNVPEGTGAIGAGLLIGSLAAWGYQILAEKRLPDDGYNAVNALWVLTFVATPGFFQPLEQEVARAVAERRAKGLGAGPVIWKAARLGAILAAMTAIVALAVFILIPSTVNQLFKSTVSDRDHVLLVGAFVVAIGTYATAYVVRGSLSGNGRFSSYGMMHGVEGIVRIIAVVGIVLITSRSVNEGGFMKTYASTGVFGFALVLPPVAAVIAALAWNRRMTRRYDLPKLAEPGPEASYSELSNALAWLLSSSVLAQILSYAPVFAAQILVGPGKADQRQLAGFLTAMFLARVPLLMFQAVQAALLPKLAASAADGQHDQFRALLNRLLVLVLAIGISGVLASLVLGKTVGKLIFNTKWTLENSELALLAAGAAAYIVAFTLAQGLIALKAYSKLTMGWFVGAVGFMAVMPFGEDIFLRAQVAFLVSSLLAAIMITYLLFKEMRNQTGSVHDLVEVLTHETLEF